MQWLSDCGNESPLELNLGYCESRQKIIFRGLLENQLVHKYILERFEDALSWSFADRKCKVMKQPFVNNGISI